MQQEDAIKLLRRICGLSLGRHSIILTVSADGLDWTITFLGKIER